MLGGVAEAPRGVVIEGDDGAGFGVDGGLGEVAIGDVPAAGAVEGFAGEEVEPGALGEPDGLAGEVCLGVFFAGEWGGEEFGAEGVLLGGLIGEGVVGAGNSGCDIAVDAIHHGKSCDLSMRRGYYFVPKYVFGRPADTLGGAIRLPMWLKRRVDGLMLKWFTGDPSKYGFPKPDYKLYESHPVVNSLVLFHAGHGDLKIRPDIDHLSGHTVHFTDGSRADYDMILTATGYKLHYPFIDKDLLNWQGDAPHLYLNAMHPTRDDLFVLGMVEASGLGWQGRHEQAEMVARYIAGRRAGSPAAQALHDEKAKGFERATGGTRYLKLARMAYYVDKATYRKAVTGWIDKLRGAKA